MALKNDLEIARGVKLRPIGEVAGGLGLEDSEWEPYGKYMAKVEPRVLERPRARPGSGKLVLVSAITPTPAGEGKTTTSIGLAQGLTLLGERACLALREPSLGPCMGIKGGATGGGCSQVAPADKINLHFTGDFHAITSANNLLAAMLDNHVYFENTLGIDPRRILFRRCLDMNDRALRRAVIGLGGPTEGVPRESGFDITAASEVMAMLCLSESESDLRQRLERTLVAFTKDGQPVTAKGLGAAGAMLALLADAIKPNLVQTLEGVPAFIHGGPFANIAHGCNSVLATRMALHLADWAVTEAGFAFDLGAEKFFDIKLRGAGLDTAAVVLVATVRALKYHGGTALADLGKSDVEAVRRGLPNLEKHIESIRCFGETPVVALNRFGDDAPEEIAAVAERVAAMGVPFALSDHFARGGEGALDLARTVLEHAEKHSKPFRPLYELEQPIPEKILAIAKNMYGARTITLTKTAERDLADIRRLGYEKLPVCIAKTQNSLSDDPKLRGRPEDFEVTVRQLLIAAGAGFIVALTGEILRMPGLPKKPLAESIDLIGGRIEGMQ
jgi:formate--tetrahydrofolate ligase